MDSQSRGSMATTFLRAKFPALLTRMSTGPNRSVADRAMRPQAAKSATSPSAASARSPPIVFATCSSASLLVRAFTTTFPPAAPSINAVARPMPREAPVTTATESRICIFPPLVRLLRLGFCPPGAEDRPRQAGGAPLRLPRDLVSPIRPDPASGFLEPSLRDRIPFQHNAIPRRDGQDIRGHPVELGVGDVDEIESVGLKVLPKGDRQESRIDDREIVVHEADQRHQMKACRGARVEREWHRFGPD